MKLSFLFYEPILDLAELSQRMERLAALHKSGYDGLVSVKIYRQLGWEEAARTAAERILPLLRQ